MNDDILAMDPDRWDGLPAIPSDVWRRERTVFTVAEARQDLETLIHDLPEYIEDQSDVESIY